MHSILTGAWKHKHNGVAPTNRPPRNGGGGGGDYVVIPPPRNVKNSSYNDACSPQEWRCNSLAVNGDNEPLFISGGPSMNIYYDKIIPCFDEGNGLLFRLVDQQRHIWSYYNDTENCTIHVSVTFGRESTVEALGTAERTLVDADSGRCRIDLIIPPGATELFMRGEYNGFCSHYEALSPYVPSAPKEDKKEKLRNN